MAEYEARPTRPGKWAVFRNGEKHTRSGGEKAAKMWAAFMNGMAFRRGW